MPDFPLVPIRAIAYPANRSEEVILGKTYRQVGVRLWGLGAYERETLDGADTQYRSLSRMEAGDIVVNKIWARNGSVAVIPPELAGCYGSGEFPTFTPDQTKLDPRWFHWITKTKWFWEQCDQKSQGTSGTETNLLMRSEAGHIFDAVFRQYGSRSFGSLKPHITSGPRNWSRQQTNDGPRFYRAQDIGPYGRIIHEEIFRVMPPNMTTRFRITTRFRAFGGWSVAVTAHGCACDANDRPHGCVPGDSATPRADRAGRFRPRAPARSTVELAGQSEPILFLSKVCSRTRNR